MDRHAPVGIFDSGNGGISVLQQFMADLPHENYIYYGDDANAPYGQKTQEQIVALSEQCTRFLMDKGAKVIAVACNTATSAAIKHLRASFDIPFVAMEPAIRPAAAMVHDGKILVMATNATLTLDLFHARLIELGIENSVITLPCPDLVEALQRGEQSEDTLNALIKEILSPYADEHVEIVVLGCTHYVHVRDQITQISHALWPDAIILDGNEGTARQLKRLLTECDLLNPQKETGTVQLFSSDPSPERLVLNERILYGKKAE